MMFGPEVEAAFAEHAKLEWPREACGVVVAGQFLPMLNAAPDPEKAFELAADIFATYEVQAVLHSHPGGPGEPSAADMQSQIETAVPWGLAVTHEGFCGPVLWWGPGVAIPPLLGRRFRHGPSGSDGAGDCYALIRDWYATERGEALPDFPRDMAWWREGQNLYREGFPRAGFHEVARGPDGLAAASYGDVLLFRLPGQHVVTHGGVLLGRGQMIHHLIGRPSCQEPVARWRDYLELVLRREVPDA